MYEDSKLEWKQIYKISYLQQLTLSGNVHTCEIYVVVEGDITEAIPFIKGWIAERELDRSSRTPGYLRIKHIEHIGPLIFEVGKAGNRIYESGMFEWSKVQRDQMRRKAK